MAERLTFVLDGRDDLSNVLGHAGDSAIRLRDTMQDAADGSNRAILTLTRDAEGRLRDMRGNIISTADATRLLGSQHTVRPLADWGAAADHSRKVGEKLKGMLISLAPAAIPAAAAMAPLAAGAAAAGVAVGVYAAALGPQISAMNEAAEAEKKYADAVAESGRGSKQAIQAQDAYARAMAKLPPATRQAAAALSVLKDQYAEWSDSLAQDTMQPFTKGLAVAGALLPKLTPLVKGTSAELDRMMTILAGGMQSPGFDRLVTQFSNFSTGVLRRVNEGLIELAMNLDTGAASGGLSEFMAYARANGPAVADTLRNMAQALMNLLVAGADVGVGMLQVINILSKLVSAVPSEVLTTLFQLVIAFKLVTLAAAGLTAVRSAMTAFGASILTMQAAAAGATGPLAKLSAAFGVLSRTAKMAVASTGIGLLVLALVELSNAGDDVPPNVDRMTTALGKFATTGQVTGEMARVFGEDLQGLGEALRVLARPSTTQSIEKFMSDLLGGLGDGGPAAKDAAEKFEAVDQALSGMVSGGKAELAAAALKRLTASLKEQGWTTEEINAQIDGYKASVEAAAFEQQLAADAMGIFGAQAQNVKGKLDAQKQSVEGLRAAILELNDTNRAAYDAEIGFEKSIDDLTASFKENGASLDLNTEKGQKNGQAMSQAAQAHRNFIEAGIGAGESLESMNTKSEKLRTTMMRLALDAFDGNKKKATDYVNTLIGVPGDIETIVKLERAEAIRGLQNVQAEIRKTPGAKSVTVSTLNAAAIKALEAVGLKTRTLPNGKTMVYTANGQALGRIAAVSSAMNRLDGTTAHTQVITTYKIRGNPNVPSGTYHGSTAGRSATGGLVRGPGTTTSDSIPMWLSDNEFVIRASSVQRFGVDFFEDLNAGRMPAGMGVGAMAASRANLPTAMSAPAKQAIVQQFNFTITGLVTDPDGTARTIDQLLTKHKRNRGGGPFEFER
ncbi:hypothetical protein ACFVY9_00420 [Streptomyces sp. NPDC059544]|uniref:hypothetical protein n=1 Tax=Streptomyces sp. NPDC059544 TaxID=3346861 RepID=UPI0036ADDE5A